MLTILLWDKDSDWIPLENAVARVKFWKSDLLQAESFLEFVESLRKYNLPNWDEMYNKAFDDIQVSREGLTRARLKLEQSKKLN